MFRYLKLGISTKCRQNKGEKGFSLVEVLIAIGLLGVVAVPFLMALATAFKAGSTADSQSVAMSLAQSQVEDVKQQDYQNATGLGAVYNSTSTAPGYSIWGVNSANATVANITGVPWDTINGTATSEAGIQKITVVIKQGNNTILTLETYKVDR